MEYKHPAVHRIWDEYYMAEKDAASVNFLRYYQAYDAWFITRASRKTATSMSTVEIASAISNGQLKHDQNIEPDGNGHWLVVHETEMKAADVDTSERIPVPTGMFKLVVSHELGVGLKPYTVRFDDYVDLQEHTAIIQQDIETFLVKGEDYSKLGLLHRRGLLLWGPPGTGKTILLEYLCSRYADEVRILVVPAGFSLRCLADLRPHLGDKIRFVLFEEVTTTVRNDPEQIASFLNFLDGTDSWNRCLVLATTNYPEQLAGNIVDRPSRFDRLYKVDNPQAGARRLYLEAKLGKDAVTDELVRLTKGYSMAYLKDIVVSIPLFGMAPLDTVKEYENRKKLVSTEFAPANAKLGF